MAKSRKTRKQKQVADIRAHQAPVQPISSQFTYTPVESSQRVSHPSSTTATTLDYAQVNHELLKTTIITSAIVIAELVLFFLM